MCGHRRDELPRERRGLGTPLVLGEMAFEDRFRGALPELRLEDGREGEAATGPPGPDEVGP